jgi:aryl-alcohol dehydrogenase-like predicted oxidoreductase
MEMNESIPRRQLGRNGPELPRLGLGMMGASGTYGLPAADGVRLKFLDEAYKIGQTFWDTGTSIKDLVLDYTDNISRRI